MMVETRLKDLYFTLILSTAKVNRMTNRKNNNPWELLLNSYRIFLPISQLKNRNKLINPIVSENMYLAAMLGVFFDVEINP